MRKAQAVARPLRRRPGRSLPFSLLVGEGGAPTGRRGAPPDDKLRAPRSDLALAVRLRPQLSLTDDCRLFRRQRWHADLLCICPLLIALGDSRDHHRQRQQTSSRRRAESASAKRSHKLRCRRINWRKSCPNVLLSENSAFLPSRSWSSPPVTPMPAVPARHL